MDTLTKADLAEYLHSEVGINKREANDLVNQFFAEIGTSLEKGCEIKLSGLGGFHLRDKVERPGRNPRTGELKSISARRVVTFRMGQVLKHLVEQLSSSHSV